MGHTVNYAVNPVKTAYDKAAVEEAGMTANIAYALNPEKGTTRLFQTAINLDDVETAWSDMKATKERWGKMDGIQGFHVVQSFAPGEVSPEIAHRIGVELVNRCFPSYEAVVGTHLDKHHIHNHIIVNSVSFLDGRKYHSSQKTYYGQLRKVSDELCRKYGLSVIQSPENDGRRKSYGEWKAEQSGQQTWCSAIRADVDAAVMRSLSFDQFIRNLKAMGYEVKTNVKHIAVRPPGKERFTRLRRLGDDYTEEALRRRILDNNPEEMPVPEEPTLCRAAQSRKGRYRSTWKGVRRSKVGGLRGLYLWYAIRMGTVRKNSSSSRKTHYLLREDIYKLKKRDHMAALLIKNRIETFDQLHAHRDECRKLISVLAAEREKLWKKERSEEESARLDVIREQMKTLRLEVRTCEEIEQDSVLLEKKREVLRSLETQPQTPRDRRKQIDRTRS